MARKDDPYSTAALDLLWGKIPFLNGVLGDISQQETDRVRAKIAAERERVAGLEDCRWRTAFNSWLDHAERCCMKAEQAREARPERDREWERMKAKRAAERDSAADLMRQNPPR